MEERLLARSSDNISKLLTLIITHEYNIKNHVRNNRVFDMQIVFDRLSLDISQNHNDLDISDNHVLNEITQTTFGELVNVNETMCAITQEVFNSEDNVVLLECGHYFKKDGFMVWARRSRSCPSCRALFR